MNETVLLAGFSHETNTFASTPTSREDFQKRREFVGDAIVENLAETNTAIGGVLGVADDMGIELVPAIAASATPGGRVAGDAYEFYTDHIVSAAREHASELDGVVLALHGAMVPENMDDGEGPLVERVREAVGAEVPIAVTHDLHGNVSDELLAAADLLVAFETYPHVDMADTGETATRLLARTMRGEIEPVMAVERPPLLPFGPRQNTREGPMAEVMAYARELEERNDILKVNVFPGFHAADVPMTGFSVPVVADGDRSAARTAAREVAEFVWNRREEFVVEYPGPADAVAEAASLAASAESNAGPVVLADVGDNPGSGGAADGTTVLRPLLDQGVTDAGFALMRDPEAVEACIDAGVGERVTLTLGGKTDDRHGDPIEDVDGYVKAITDGQFVNTGPMATGTTNHLGRTVRLHCGEDDGIAVIITENRLQPLDAEIFRHVGIQPERLDILVVKSKNHFRADYEPMASHVVLANSPGLGTMDARNFDYDRIQRPKFPIDEMDDDDYPDW